MAINVQATWSSSNTVQATWSRSMADRTEIRVYRATAPTIEITNENNSGSISAWTLQFTVRRRPEMTGSPLIDLTTAGGGGASGTTITITDAAAGDIAVAIPYSVMAALKAPRKYFWELRRTNSGSQDVLAWGDFVILAQAGVAAS